MIHITQLIFIAPGKESLFHEFEDAVIPIMAEYTGKMLYRIRPERGAFIEPSEELPYEVHIITFESKADLDRFLADERRQKVLHLKEASVRSSRLITS